MGGIRLWTKNLENVKYVVRIRHGQLIVQKCQII